MTPERQQVELAAFLEWGLREYRRIGSRAHPIDIRPAEAWRRRLLVGEVAPLVSDVGHDFGQEGPALVTIDTAVRMAVGVVGPSTARAVRRWAVAGRIRAEKYGGVWLVDPVDVAVRLSEG